MTAMAVKEKFASALLLFYSMTKARTCNMKAQDEKHTSADQEEMP